MFRRFVCLLFAVISALFIPPSAPAQQSLSTTDTYIPAEVPDSTEGLQAQVDELVRVAKTHDQANWQIALSTFSLPNADSWFQANFAPEHLAQLTQDYPQVRDGHLGHTSWVIGHNQDAPNFRIQVAPSEMPAPPAEAGFEGALPRPLHHVPLQNFRLTAVADSGSMPPSWVSSFVYVDGHFRVVGGTYPFWAEKLQSLRAGTMSLPKNVQAAHLIHKVSPKYPKKARKEHVEGVVRLHAIIGKDGGVHELTVISGSDLLIGAALQAVRQWRYEPMKLNGEPVEVDTTIDVLFSLNR